MNKLIEMAKAYKGRVALPRYLQGAIVGALAAGLGAAIQQGMTGHQDWRVLAGVFALAFGNSVQHDLQQLEASLTSSVGPAPAQ